MFQVPERQGRTYSFNLGGEAYSLPAFDALAMDELAEIAGIIEDGGSGDPMARAFLAIFERYVPGIASKLDRTQFTALVNDYIDEAREKRGADLGESQGSSD